MLAQEIKENKIIDLKVYKESKKPLKYKLDGTPKNNTHSNGKPGVSKEVYALKTKEDIEAVMNVLEMKILESLDEQKEKQAYRNKLLFIIGMNIGIRASDIRLLKWSFFLYEKDGELAFRDFYKIQPVKTKKTGKFIKMFFNQAVQRAIVDYIKKYPINDIEEYIFMSRQGNEPITTAQMWNIVKGTIKEAGLNINVGTHTFRKTFGYHIWHNAADKNKTLVLLQVIFNHSSQSVTANYIGLTDNDIKEVFNDLNIGIEYTDTDSEI